jgi:formylglycine-generating enzyme required for sulfatase activity
VGVSFWEAEAFAAWTGGSLPSERQWEAAARGREGYKYPWGDTWEDGICNSSEAGLRSTSVVGIFPRSKSAPLGLEDLAGNVFEWCTAESGGVRVLRGGCWGYYSGDCRAANRTWTYPETRNTDVGCRVLSSVSPGLAQ